MRIAYAYLKQQTWLYRRNYPKVLQPVLGQALKQSLKTGDAKEAKVRAAEVNALYETIVAKAREGIVQGRPEPVKVAPPDKQSFFGKQRMTAMSALRTLNYPAQTVRFRRFFRRFTTQNAELGGYAVAARSGKQSN
ncbi:hypothetical protein SAMN06265173_1161 [Thalassovita litoralis]|uniref:DUF6538 domain-containing protein n=2 Tax=Thalassovita litoralis TaxID=1010611 RepID=A0A521ECX4_9RHOB|nr:hypothetical protein SAMN06265173_1161 [Thalassovita litoralis]